MNILAQLGFELTYDYVAVQYITHNTMETLSLLVMDWNL